jgi:hypothetical protein
MTETAQVMDGIASEIGRMVDQIRAARKDGLYLDFSRLIGIHFGRMVEESAETEGKSVSAHNNKVLFLEAIDLWSRGAFARGIRKGPALGSARAVIAAVMEPVYEAMSLDDPSLWRGRLRTPPAYNGPHVDAVAAELGLAACLEIVPIRLRFGIDQGVPKHVWGLVQADRRWFDTDISRPDLALGEHLEFEEYDEVEVPL